MRIELRLLEYVLAVAEEGGFSAAAERLHMAQPPLSRQIAELERRIGAPLFTRRPVAATELGQIVVDGAREILQRAAVLTAAIEEAAHGAASTVRVGYVLSAAYDTLPRLVATVQAHAPSLVVHAEEGWAGGLERSLLEGRLDLVVAHTLPMDDRFAHRTLRVEPLAALVGASHPLAGSGEAWLRQLGGGTFTFYAARHAPAHHDLLLRALQASGAKFHYREDPVPGMRRPALDGDEFTLVPASMAAQLASATLRQIRLLEPDLPRIHTDLVWSTRSLSPAAAALLEVTGTVSFNEPTTTAAKPRSRVRSQQD